jgi:DNA modification methylase
VAKKKNPKAFNDHEWQRQKLGKIQAGAQPKAADFSLFGEGLLGPIEPLVRGKIMARFIYPPFSILNAREGVWQNRKRAWLALGIQSELGRFDAAAAPGHSPRPAADYGKSHARGDGAGHAIAGTEGAAYTDLGDRVAKYRGKKTFGTTDEQKRYKANSACRPHSGHDPRPGRPRGEDYAGGDAWVSSGDEQQTGTSIFDPVLTELCYRWFCPPGGTILDPFAGGSVRGIVAACLDREYLGIELRAEQLASNIKQASEILGPKQPRPVWVEADAKDVNKLWPKAEFDFVFSCPPYGSLEIYSDDPRDLSQMEPAAFLETYRKIIRRTCRCLRDDRFACFVVGDYRLKDGTYANFTSQTIAAFQDAGLRLYNSAVLITAVGSLPIRIAKQFQSGRKLGRTHQDVLVFVKGDWKRAAAACGEL